MVMHRGDTTASAQAAGCTGRAPGETRKGRLTGAGQHVTNRIGKREKRVLQQYLDQLHRVRNAM